MNVWEGSGSHLLSSSPCLSSTTMQHTASQAVTEQIRNFRLDRIGKCVADDTPLLLEDGGKIMLHIVPYSSLDPMFLVDITIHANRLTNLRPLGLTGWDYRHNFDGFVTFRNFPTSPKSVGYVQFFRNGSIEAVDSFMLRGNQRMGQNIIPSIAYEHEILRGLHRYFGVLKDVGVEGPLAVMLSLVGVSGYRMYSSDILQDRLPIDRDVLVVPEIVVDNYDVNLAGVMRPAFDSIWNSAGWLRSFNYDDKGNWIRERYDQ